MRGAALTRRLVLAAAAASLLPHFGRAQSPARRRIAFLAVSTRETNAAYLAAFRDGLRALGYGDVDVALEIRYADSCLERLPGLAAELVRMAPEVMVAGSPSGERALQQAGATIPIVMASGDPVAAGLVASVARPGGNVTGPSCIAADSAGKWLELLIAVAPRARRIAVVVNPGNPRTPASWTP